MGGGLESQFSMHDETIEDDRVAEVVAISGESVLLNSFDQAVRADNIRPALYEVAT